MNKIVIYRKHPCVKHDLTIKLAKQGAYDEVIVKEIFDEASRITHDAQVIINKFQLKVAPLVQVFDKQQHLVATWGDFSYSKIVNNWDEIDQKQPRMKIW